MNYNFFIIGGDNRMYYLAKNLSKDGNNVKTLGLEKIGYENLVNNNIKIAHSINEIDENDILIGGIPISMDNKTFYTPFSDKEIYLNEINGKEIIAGKIPERIKGIDILKEEGLAIFNSIPTVEGAIAKAIENDDNTIMDANILVLGFGRIGKILCDRLKKLGANVYCTARKKEDIAWIEANGYVGIEYNNLDNNLCKMDIIFNTVPSIVLNKKRLIMLKENALVIDLASNPGGIDKESARILKTKYLQYLGIPGKIAPNKSSLYIKDYLYKMLEEKDKN